jgi:hypothetical protein
MRTRKKLETLHQFKTRMVFTYPVLVVIKMTIFHPNRNFPFYPRMHVLQEPETFSNCGGGSIDILKEVHPEKLSRLHERLVTPIQSGGYCPLPSFPGQQEFYHDFILHSSHPTFLQHLADSLASEILVLNETSFVASDLEDTGSVVLNRKDVQVQLKCYHFSQKWLIVWKNVNMI